jgi:ATP-dependent protease ClpP protease subunit
MAYNHAPGDDEEREGTPEIAIVGELTDNEADITDKLLSVPAGEECVLYFDTPGGSPYVGLSLMTLIVLRGLRATGIVTGECSSAALWPYAACHKRLVTPFSFMLFHPIRWESDERLTLTEAAEWARHFRVLEQETDKLLAKFFGVTPAKLAKWMTPGRYVSGREMAEAGLAEMVELASLSPLAALAPVLRRK